MKSVEAKWKREALHAQEILKDAHEKAKLSEKAHEEVGKSEKLAVEVQALRGQLTNLRKKMAEAHWNDSVDVSEDKSSSSSVYESVISRLKQELMEEGAERRALQQQLSKALEQASRAESLEEEMILLDRSSKRTQDGLAETTRLKSL